MTTDFSFTAISRLTIEHTQGAVNSQFKSCDLRLELSNNLNKDMYIRNELPTKEALKPITQALIHGLIVNMRMGAARGWWKEGEHMQYVIDELQRAFVMPGSDPFISEM